MVDPKPRPALTDLEISKMSPKSAEISKMSPKSALFVAAVVLVAVCGCENTAPSVPVLSGPSTVLVDSAATFRAVTTDPDADSVAFRFDWGDSSKLVWSDHIAPGDTFSAPHTYTKHGTFVVRVRAKDTEGNMTGWSAPLSLTAAPGPYPWRLVDTIRVGYGQVSGAISPDGRYLYVAGEIDQSVYVIRTSDDSVVLELDMLERGSWSNSREVVASPDGQYVYASWYSTSGDQIAVIRTSDFSVVDSVDVGDGPSGMSISPDGGWLAAGGHVSPYVMYVVSTQTRTADTVFLPEDIGRLATVASPDGSCFYACGDCDLVAVVSTADWTVTDTIEFSAGYFPLLSPDGKYFYSAATEDTEVVAFSIPEERVKWSVELPYPGYPSAISADGEYIYGIMTEEGLEGVSWFFVVRVSDQTLVHTVELPCEVDASRIVLAPSGDKAYVPGDSRIYVVAR